MQEELKNSLIIIIIIIILATVGESVRVKLKRFIVAPRNCSFILYVSLLPLNAADREERTLARPPARSNV